MILAASYYQSNDYSFAELWSMADTEGKIALIFSNWAVNSLVLAAVALLICLLPLLVGELRD